MAKMTLLDMTQNILSAIDSDAVNNVGDTTESLQVAEVIRETYFDLISSRDWPFLKSYGTLTGLGDVDNPTKMQFPEDVNKVYWIKYNKKDVTWMDPKEFQDMLDLREELVDVVDENGYIINRDPLYWTTFDDDYVLFDSIDLAEDTTLQQSKSKAYVLLEPEWTLDNDFVPSLPSKMFPLLLADAKGTCFLNLKQTSNAKEERKAQRLRVRMQNEAHRNNEQETKSNRTVDYGRK
jgi:hypothetical protein